MTKPSTEAEYLATFTPPSVAVARGLRRRSLLKGAGALGVGALSVPLLSACGGSDSSSSGSGDSGSVKGTTVTVGSNASDAVPKKAFADVYAAFTKSTGVKTKVNTVDHNTFQEQITNYLQGGPDDVSP